jgi:aerobic carbon-monoxide dehydrogenase small subunit
MSEHALRVSVNGTGHDLTVPAQETLLDSLHDRLGRQEVRYGCGEGVCGTCTVLIDGTPATACLMFTVQVGDQEVTTLSGITPEDSELHPLQQQFLDHGASQCGFCTPGILLTVLALEARGERPTREQLRYELVGNLCRCTGYTAILDAIEAYLDRDGS